MRAFVSIRIIIQVLFLFLFLLFLFPLVNSLDEFREREIDDLKRCGEARIWIFFF